MTTTNINDTFFNGFYKDVWKKLIPAGLSEAECDFIEQISSLQPYHHVLDLMCGYGRHTLPLARKGFRLTAIDIEADYIREIKEATGELPIEAQTSSLLQMRLQGSYDAAICMGNSFCFFSREEALSILQNLSQHLKPGGCFIINTWMLGEIAIRHFKEKEWFYLDDYKYLIDCNYLFQPARVEADHIIIRNDGVTETLKSVDYIFTIAEMDALLSEAGFQLKEIYSIPRKKKFRLGDSKAYMVAWKL